MVKHTQAIRWNLPTNCLSVFDHCMGLVLKGLTTETNNKKTSTGVVQVSRSITYKLNK